MEQYLDNPAWNALISGNKNMAFGNEQVKYFDRDVSPFAALKENSADNFKELYEVVPHEAPLLIAANKQLDIPAPWSQLRCIHGIQMICKLGPATAITIPVKLTPLTQLHVPQMLSLTQLTNPGPFGPGTIAFGHYEGIFEGERLAAMAGQRFHVFDYMEISAVCTHPDYTGRGYAKQLLQLQIKRIIAANGTPFLHVRRDNERAIAVYESLGFSTRTDIYFYVIKKTG